ncbi:MAG: hypothetical protein Q3976_01615 [Corynebacterium sp.]|nr:hypothetical protein [Corynebacterium sp.]
MHRRIAALTFATVLPLAAMQPAQAATPGSEAFVGSVFSRVVDFFGGFFGSEDAAAAETTTVEASTAETTTASDEVEMVSFDCPGSTTQYFEIEGGIAAVGPALCWAPADQVEEILAAATATADASEESVSDQGDQEGNEEAISFKCPAVAPVAKEVDGKYVLVDEGVCWKPSGSSEASDKDEHAATVDKEQVVDAAAEGDADDYISVPCEGSPEVTEVDGKQVFTGTGLCFVEAGELANA